MTVTTSKNVGCCVGGKRAQPGLHFSDQPDHVACRNRTARLTWMRSRKETRCGEVNKPTRKPAAR